MEGSSSPIGAPARGEPSALRLTQAGLLLAGLGAMLVIFDAIGLGVVGLVLATVGTVMAAPGALGERWYWAVAAGTAIMILSRLIAEGAQVTGGWLGVLGAIVVLVGVTLGFPVRGARP